MKFAQIQWQSELYEAEIQLRYEMLSAPLGLTFTAQQLAAEEDELHFGVMQDDRLVACVVVVPKTEQLAKVRQMAVRPDKQRSGLGRFLIQNVEQHLQELGYKQIELNARVVAVGFYERLGYETVGEEFIEVSIPHFKMTKVIG